MFEEKIPAPEKLPQVVGHFLESGTNTKRSSENPRTSVLDVNKRITMTLSAKLAPETVHR
jgi:hypothetical protein